MLPHRPGSRRRFGHLPPPLSRQAVSIRLDVVLVEQGLAAEPSGLDKLPHTAPTDAVVDGARADPQDLCGFLNRVIDFFQVPFLLFDLETVSVPYILKKTY